MSHYNPAPGSIVQQSTYFVPFLSQRDLSLSIPVNFVNQPGVVLTAACFGHGRYDDVAATQCFSNLLATGFRRVEADVYWDASRQTWSLCPVELGSTDGPLTTSASVAQTPLQTSATRLATQLLSAGNDKLLARQQSSGALQVPSFSSTSVSTPSLSTTATVVATPTKTNTSSLDVAQPSPTSVSSSNGTLYDIGPYMCTQETDFELLVRILSAHLGVTETDLNATIVTLTLNLHAAASVDDPAGPAKKPAKDALPSGSSLLSSVLLRNASVYVYTPDDLREQRSNLNDSKSWFAVSGTVQPDDSYFTINGHGSQSSTPDGWPSESYIEIANARRLIVGFGTIDPQMRSYNFSGDESYIFAPGVVDEPRRVTATTEGNITEGCFFDANDTSLSNVNSSFAITGIGNDSIAKPQALPSLLAHVRNLTYCGISPILNATLDNLTADQDYRPYASFVGSTIWSWASDQPLNATARDEYQDYRCAAMNSTSGYWQAADCGQSHYGACRQYHEPYIWRITSRDAPYDRVERGCEDNTKFDVPRTALESAYLLSEWRRYQRENDDDSGPLLFLDFNDLDVSTCWVIGQNTSCPYQQPSGRDTREVVVPVVGGIIVFVLALLTICVKCAGNRQQSKRRRRRGDGGWDYEGVPS